MRVTTKITVTLSTAALLVFGANGLSRLREERREQLAEAQREARTLATAVRVAVENALRDSQLGDVQETLDSLEGIDPGVDTFILDTAGNRLLSSKGAAPLTPTQTKLVGEVRTQDQAVLHIEETGTPPEVVLVTSLTNAHETKGFLLFVKPLVDLERNLAAARAEITRSVATFVVLVSLVGFFLGTIYVKRPLDRLVTAMERLRKGDFNAELVVTTRDEVSTLAEEYNNLVIDLRETRTRLAAEQESRRILDRELQRVDKLVTIGQLAAGLAHEVGSPLQILNGRAHSLLTKSHDAAAVQKNARILIDESDRLARILDQLLAFSRRRAPRMARIDAQGAVEEIVDLVSLVAQRRQVRLSLDSPGDLPSVVADRDQFQQVVLNLINNALDASSPGTTIVISLSASTLRAVDGALTVPALRITVQDQGCGMLEDTLSKCFEPFFTTRADNGGTGLGLSVVKTIVADHGGVIRAESQLSVGSYFTVDLPLPGPVWRNRMVA